MASGLLFPDVPFFLRARSRTASAGFPAHAAFRIDRIDLGLIARLAACLHGLQFHPLDHFGRQVRQQPHVSAFEDGEAVGRFQIAINLAHFKVIEILGAGGFENRKRQFASQTAIGIAGARCKHACDVGRR